MKANKHPGGLPRSRNMQFPPSSHSFHDFHMFLLRVGAATDDERHPPQWKPIYTHIAPRRCDSGGVPPCSCAPGVCASNGLEVPVLGGDGGLAEGRASYITIKRRGGRG